VSALAVRGPDDLGHPDPRQRYAAAAVRVDDVDGEEERVAGRRAVEAAAKDARIRKTKGLGTALQMKILQNLAIASGGVTQLHLHKAAALLEQAVAALKHEHPDYSRVEIAGDFRRGCELVTELAVVAETRDPPKDYEASGGLKLAVTDKKHFGASL